MSNREFPSKKSGGDREIETEAHPIVRRDLGALRVLGRVFFSVAVVATVLLGTVLLIKHMLR